MTSDIKGMIIREMIILSVVGKQRINAPALP